tara:strand:+ start:776 stop:901 length:126 start_codon:yes stop_codon:yes gene_type:complete
MEGNPEDFLRRKFKEKSFKYFKLLIVFILIMIVAVFLFFQL